jgi:hypothetical protein
MRNLFTLICTFTVFLCYGQQKGAINVRKMKEKYYITKTCYDFLAWDEVVLKNKTIANWINSTIRTTVKGYRISKWDAAARCSGQMEYEPEFKIVYAAHGVISYELTAYTFFKGAAHGGRQFQSLNFDSRTGSLINFHEMIDSSTITTVDSLIIQKLKKQLGSKDNLYLDEYKEQLPHVFFAFTEKGIDINFLGDSYWRSIVSISFTYKELGPYAKKGGILNNFTAR